MSRIAIDSNILVYVAGVWVSEADQAKVRRASKIVKHLQDTEEVFVPVQVLGEVFVVLRRNGFSAEDARAVVIEFSEGFIPVDTTRSTFAAALDLVIEHRLQFWDALIVNAAAEAGCTLLLSEDMQDGFMLRGVTIVNPLADKPHEKLARLLA